MVGNVCVFVSLLGEGHVIFKQNPAQTTGIQGGPEYLAGASDRGVYAPRAYLPMSQILLSWHPRSRNESKNVLIHAPFSQWGFIP